MGRLTVAITRLARRAWRTPLGAAPAEPTSYEALARRVLHEQGPLPLQTLVDCIAERPMRADRLRGASGGDVALWGRELYRREAIEAVRRMFGRSLALQGKGPWLLAVPAT